MVALMRLLALVALALLGLVGTALPSTLAAAEYRRHTNNWAVVVDTSRFWNNYRHIANALSLYHSVKRLGIPDSQVRSSPLRIAVPSRWRSS